MKRAIGGARRRAAQVRFRAGSSVVLAWALLAFAGGKNAGAPGDDVQSIIPFTQEGLARGLNYYVPTPQTNGIYGFGSGFADLDGDGDLDIVVIGREDGVVGIFENDGRGFFTSRTAASGIEALERPSGFAAGDYDGDGLPDLYITQIAVTGRLYRNNGDFTFTDVTQTSGCTTGAAAKAPAWGDFDGDGWLDLYVPSYRNAWPGTSQIPSSLFRNNGDGTFTDVASSFPGFTAPAYTFTGTWVDIDRDGDVDFYTSNDRGHLPPFFQENQLFRNDGGTLVEITEPSGAGISLFSMGLGVGDFDANGYPDFYLTNIAHPAQPLGPINPLLLNQGDTTFLLAHQQWGVSMGQTGWGAVFFDFDNNGYLDLYVSNQWVPNRLYWNPGHPPAIDVSGQAAVPGTSFYSFASSVGDVDGDGDLDLLVGDLGSHPLLYINHEGERRNWILLTVVGDGSNKAAVGGHAIFWLDDAKIPQYRDIAAGGRSYLGQDSFDVHIGLASQATLAHLEFQWPLGTPGMPRRTLTGLPANQRWTVYPPSRLGDADGDGLVGSFDAQVFGDCMELGFSPGCEMMDFNGDASIDSFDSFAFFHRLSDFDGDGVVGAADLSMMLGAWGTSEPLCDVSGNGSVGSEDLAILLGLWGPAPPS